MPYSDRLNGIPIKLIIGLADIKALPRKMLLPMETGKPRIFPTAAKVLDGDWDLIFTRIEDSDIYHKLYQFLNFGISQQFSNNFVKAYGGKDTIFGKNSEAFYRNADSHLSSLIALVRESKITGLGEDEDDEPNFLITRNGEFLLYDGGRNRAILATMLGIKHLSGNVIARHAQWANNRQKLMTGPLHYQELLHPDLRLVEGAYTKDRAKRILSLTKNMQYFDPAHKTMIDIGSNWGIMCDVFEDAGFFCLAIEKDEITARELQQYRSANRKRYGIITDISALDITSPWRADVILMLNILHHLYAQDPHKLQARLRAINANKIIFTAPHHRSSFKNEDDFAYWVSQQITFPHELVRCMPDGLRLDKYPNGRMIYAINRLGRSGN